MPINSNIKLPLVIALFSYLVLPYAQAAIITANSELEFRHAYEINNGSVPQGVNISNSPQTLSISGGALSSIDDPAALEEDNPFVQVGNPFTSPALPFRAIRDRRSTYNAGTEGAQSDYDVSVTSRDDPEGDPTLTSIVERSVENSGGAEIRLATQDIAAQANSFYNSNRGYLVENISNNRQVFSITGDVSFDFLSEFEGDNGFASAGMSVFTLFEKTQGVAANFSLNSPYTPNIIENGSGASVFESLTFNEPNFDGFLFTGSTMAQANGGTTTASLSELFSYRLDLIMEAGSSFEFFSGFSQSNAVEYNPQSIDVDAPLGMGLFSIALLSLALTRRFLP
ncbi:hypothetical protein [Glaciecola sp. SC05]|uniref:hypothetical protein n=1 Tax=Glaciecola sp. SC05 TaxID=1987355 RepID=UPI003528CBF7